jgi:FKBP-type peptidyl-prolyl cis-trans isomerase
MLWRLILGIAVTTAILFALGLLNRTPTLEKVLANGPGPQVADAPEEFSEPGSGLRYRIHPTGGGEKPQATDTVTVHYAGWLNNGTEFDRSYGSEPFTTTLNRVVRGWTEGLQLVREGGMIELEIPAELGYGSRGGGSTIPPYSTLHFLVELLEIQEPPEPLEPGPRDSDAPEEFTTTESGLKYRVLRKSDGPQPATSDTVTVHYKGWLDDGTDFDSSYDRGEPTTFPLGGVIPGWTEGLTYVNQGGMIELEIPSDLGYGASGHAGIPPNATLHFLVELLEIQ